MKRFFRLAYAGALLLAAAGCSQRPESAHSGAVARSGALLANPTSLRAEPTRQGFASLPDRGELIAYPRQPVRQDGAYTWHRTDLSEAHALNAIADGNLRLTTPSGETLVVRYDRHIEHGSGDWTWVGHIPGQEGEQTILTFGPHAAFGSIAQPGKPPLRLTVRNGVSWLVETDPTKVAGIINAATRPQRPDYIIPPKSGVPNPKLSATSAPSMASAPAMAAATTSASTTVDLVLGYTPAFASDNGGQSGAITRLNYLVDVTNISYANSSISARVRLVATVPVSYPDNTSNDTTLDQLTGYDSSSNTTTSANSAFSGLRAAREQYGADLVSMVRSFRDPENGGCGVGWLIGGGQQGISSSDSYYGYSVVSDGSDVGTDGHTYFCLDETLAHELGHNMGAQHDVATAQGADGVLNPGDYGVYSYSFGFKSQAGFYTIMAYGNAGQQIYRIFSDPRSTFCGGVVCGTSQADNARTLTQTIPIVATFRATVVTTAPPHDLYVIAKMGASGYTELHTLSAASLFQTFTGHVATALYQTGTDYTWRFQMGDYNRDGIVDMYAIGRSGGSGRTEVHVLNGADGYRTFLAHIATALRATGSNNGWIFKLGDYDRDGILDLYAIDRNGASGHTDLHVLNGATNFTTFSAHMATALYTTGYDGAWDFALGDYNHDGLPDLFVISKLGPGSGTTEVHVLNGADRFQTWLLHRATALNPTGSDNTWVFKVGDYDGDGAPDIYAINKQGGSGRTEVHVLDGARGYTAFSAHVATALQSVGGDDAWELELAASP